MSSGGADGFDKNKVRGVVQRQERKWGEREHQEGLTSLFYFGAQSSLEFTQGSDHCV